MPRTIISGQLFHGSYSNGCKQKRQPSPHMLTRSILAGELFHGLWIKQTRKEMAATIITSIYLVDNQSMLLIVCSIDEQCTYAAKMFRTCEWEDYSEEENKEIQQLFQCHHTCITICTKENANTNTTHSTISLPNSLSSCKSHLFSWLLVRVTYMVHAETTMNKNENDHTQDLNNYVYMTILQTMHTSQACPKMHKASV